MFEFTSFYDESSGVQIVVVTIVLDLFEILQNKHFIQLLFHQIWY